MPCWVLYKITHEDRTDLSGSGFLFRRRPVADDPVSAIGHVSISAPERFSGNSHINIYLPCNMDTGPGWPAGGGTSQHDPSRAHIFCIRLSFNGPLSGGWYWSG